jgi:hypothetical protein
MIKVRGSARRFFTFSADLPMAYAYYSDVSRLLSYLPHICLVQAYGPDRFRLLFSTTELGTYKVRIFADVEATLGEQWILRVRPLGGFAPVKAQSTLGTTTAQGYFSSRSVFSDSGDRTRVEYQLELEANLPTPYGLRFMPGVMVNRIAKSITKMRTREIVEGFIQRSVAAYPHWLAEMEAHGSQRPVPQTLGSSER